MLPLKFDLPRLIGRPKKNWWIEIGTTFPRCIYFFGPFYSFDRARNERDGYIEDLVAEKAFGITVEIKQCQPNLLTIFEEPSTSSDRLNDQGSMSLQHVLTTNLDST